MKNDILINKNYLLSSDFIPKDLFQTDPNTNNFHKYKDPSLTPMISLNIMPYFLALQNAAEKKGYHIIVDSGYRSFHYQQVIWDKNVLEKGLEETKKYVAVPGSSEHQSGLAFDMACLRGISLEYDDHVEENDDEIKWMEENAYQYGFILRYPKNKEGITGYHFEPWHYRFVGIPLATLLKENNLTLEEYYLDKEKYDSHLSSLDERQFITILDFLVAYRLVETSTNSYSNIFYLIDTFLKEYPMIEYVDTPNYYIQSLEVGVNLLTEQQINQFVNEKLVDFMWEHLGKKKINNFSL